VTLALDFAVQGGFTVDVNTADGTATTADGDYTAVSGQTITFAGTLGETQTFTVLPTTDTKLEANETVLLSMTNLAGTSLSVDITDGATLTITNDDAAAVTIADVSGLEDGGAITVTLALDFAVQGGFTVDVNTADGTATTADGDYTAVSGQTITFAGTLGETQTFTVLPTTDTKLEANETVLLSMTNLAGTSLSVDITDGATLTITNDDAAAVTIADVSGLEDGGAITVTLALDFAVQGGFTVDVNTADGTATTADGDYTAVSGQTITFAGTLGETQTFTVTPTIDTKLEADETIGLSMNNLAGTSLSVDITDGATLTITNDDAAAVTIADVSGLEDGGAITVTLALDFAVQGGFTVDVNTADGTATTADGDYTAVSGQTITFAGTLGETQTFTVTPTIDTKLEADETIGLSMTNLAGTSLSVDITDGATLTITNDDAAAVTIADVSGLEDGGAITVTLALDFAVQGGFTVDVNTADGTATTADGDYTAVTSQTITFAGTLGETQTFTVTPTIDTKLEADETIGLSMNNLAGTSLSVDITDGATLTITNDDAAAVTIADVSGLEDGGAITVTLALDFAVQGGFTVDVNTADGTATTVDGDYTAVTSQTITFAGTLGETQTFTVTPTIDTKLEADETIGLSMNNLAGTSLSVDITDGATLTITNDDAAAVTIADVSGAEDGGAITVTLALDYAVQGGFTVDVNTADGTATTADGDYTAVSGQTITFAGTLGETQTFTVTPTIDTKLEADETIGLSMNNLAGTSLSVDITDGATLTITNDDAAAVTIADVSGLEDGGAITVTLALDFAVQGGFTVDVNTADGTATTADGDYTAVSGQTITFAGTLGETQTFTVLPTTDTKLEANETVLLSMTNLAGTSLSVDITDGATLTITNDDAAAVTIADVSGLEDGGAITVTLALDFAVQGGFTVDVNTADGTATTADGDYTAVSGQTITFAGTLGETQTFTVLPTTDTKLEANETVLLSMTNLAGTSLSVDITDGATLTITNDDAAAVTIADVSGLEDGGAITVTLALDFAVQGGFTVDVNTADGTATTADGDYTAVSGQTITFAGTLGETQTFTVTPTIDTKLEADETIGLSMNNLAGTSLSVDITDGATLTITNDDAAAVTIADVSGLEDGGAITVTLALDFAVQGGFTVDVNTADGTATTADGDYTAVSGQTITFAGTLGETQTFTVTPTIDTKLEADETIGLSMNNLAGTSLSVDITDGATLTITNDDAAAVTIADVSGLEDGGAITVTLALDFAVQGGFTVDVNTADGTATTADGDYTAVTSQTITFAGTLGETQTFTVTPTIDTKLEADETIGLSMNNLAGTSLSVDITDGATLTITNDDAAAVTIADVSGLEDGGAITVTLALDFAVQGGFTVDVNTADGTATTVDGDYTAVTSQTITFAGTLGETQTFTVTPTIDTKLEADETIGLSMNNLAGTSLSVDITDGATLTITNDDAAAVTIADVSGAEDGGAITVTLALDYAVQGGFTVDVNTADGTATTADGDYTAVSGQTITFAGTLGETQTFTVLPTTDTKLEANETVLLSMTNLAGTSLSVDITDGATLTITNDDAAAVTIADVSGLEDGGAITVTLALDFAVQGGFTVDVNTADGTATTADGDYTAVSGQTITFAGTLGETQTFTVLPTTDTKLEANETVLLSMTNLAGTSLSVDITDGATLTITNDDAAAVTIADVSGLEDGGAITVTLALDFAVQGGFTVDVNTADGTATTVDGDYTAVTSQTITFAGTLGETQTFTVTPTIDTKLEADETIGLSMNNLAGTSLSVDITDGATLTITNDDAAAVTIADVSGAEDGGAITVTLALDFAVQGGFTVDVNTADGTATTADGDYTAVSGQTITFAGTLGETQTFTVLPTTDTKLEANETVLLSMTNLAGTSLSVDITDGATLTITNDDAAAVTIADVSGLEDGGAITVTLALDFAVQGGFTVDVNTADGTATTADGDYTAVSGQTITFAGTLGETQTFTVLPTTDTKLEANETVLLSMTNLAGTSLSVDITDGATLTITNDDAAAVTIADVSGLEDGGAITVTLALDFAVQGGFTVDVNTADGTATTADGDYTAVTSQTITFAGTLGETQTFTVTPTIDTKLEADETIGLSMNNLAGTSLSVDITDGATLTITNDDAAAVTIADVSGLEDGGAITVTLALDFAVQGGFTVDVNTADGTATTADGDYTAVSGQTITFAGTLGETQTFTVTPTIDTKLEADETIGLSMNNLAGTSLSVDITDGATLTITNDDAAAVTIADVSGLEDGGAITVTLALDFAVQGGFTVDVNTADGTATTADGDYTAVSGQTITFAGTLGETQTFTVLPTTDTKLEANETVLLSMTNLAGTSLSVDITDGATLTITNDDAAAVTIADVSGLEDGGAITVTLALDFAVQGGFTVDVNTADGTATTVDGDYTAVTSQTITFAGTLGETQTFTVTPTIDTKLEADETIGLSMNNLAGTSLSVDITDGATLTITNDDAAAVTIADVSGAEDGGAITVTLALDFAVQGGFTVDVNTADGTATTADGDYTAVSGQTITFAGTLGETQTFTVLPTTDTKLEANETVLLSMTNLAGTSLSVDITDGATLTITNDDAAAVTIADVSGLEDGGAITVTLALDFAVQGGFTVDVNTADGTATTADGDYTAVSGQTITFAGTLGETQTFTVLPTTDTKLEANETVLLSMTNLAGTSLSVDITDGATLTITNDDAAAVTIADVSGLEDGGAITVTLALDFAVQGGFTVDVNTADGTATTADGDYTAVSGQTITFAGTLGETQTFTVTPTIDTKLEADETIGLSMNNLAGTSLSVDITDGATLTITNDDAAAVTIADVSGLEDGGAITVTLALDFAVQGGFTVDVNTADGTATTADGDYTAVSGQTITFAGTLGETQTFTVLPTTDTKLEANETVLLSMTNLAGTSLSVDITDGATLTITNDDAAAVTIADVSGLEDGGAITVTLALDFAVQGGFTVDVNTADGTATTADGDYTAVSGQTITFAGTLGETQTFTVLPTTDTKLEANETVLLSMTNLAGTSLSVDITDGATLTITNDDAAAVTIADVSGLEDGGAITVTLALDFAVQGGFTVDVNTADGTATTADGDYTAVSGQTITFAGTLGETQTFTVLPTTDTKLEANETVLLSMTNLAGTSLSVDITDGATLTITNDDAAAVTIADVSGLEDGGAITVTLALDFAVQGGFTVDVNTADGTATTADGDYTAVSGQTITFAGTLGETQTFTVTPTSDNKVELDESLAISMNNLVGLGVNITDGATITILNDDAASFSITDVTVNEPAGPAAFTVTLSAPVQNLITINYATSDNTALQPGDYTSTSGTLTFGGANPLVQTINVPIIDDPTIEPTEYFDITLSTLVANSQNVTINDGLGVGTILSDDIPSITCPANIIQGNDLNVCNALVAIPTQVYSTNWPTALLSWTMTGTMNTSGNGQIGNFTFNVGTTTVTYLAYDNISSNTASCSFTVTVNDTEDPRLAGAYACSSLSSSGWNECLSVAAAYNAASTTMLNAVKALYTDNCDNDLTVTLSNTTPGATNSDCSWSFTYEYTITDDATNSVTCTVTRSGGDQTAPTFTQPADITIYKGGGAGSSGTYTIVNYDFNAGTSYATLTPILMTNFTSTAINSSIGFGTIGGVASSGAFTSNPVAGNALNVGNSSNGGNWRFDIAGSALPNASTYAVYCQVYRAGANSANSLNFEYSSDNGPWTSFGISSVTSVTTWVPIIHSLPAINPLSTLSIRISLSGGGGSGPKQLHLDNFQVQAYVTQSGCTYDASVAQTGDVTNESDNCASGIQATYTDATAIGNCPDDLIITRTWSLTDGCNTTTHDQIITVEDNAKPVIDNSNKQDLTVECDGSTDPGGAIAAWLANNAGATATDNCDASPSWSHNYTGLSNGCGATGTATVTFTVVDNCSNAEVTTATVTIVDTQAPYLVNAGTGCSSLNSSGNNWCLSVADAFDGNTLTASVQALYTDNCGTVTASYTGKTAGANNSDCGWIFTYHYTITDECNNSVTCDVVYSGGDTEVPHLVNSQVDCSSLDITAQNECLSAASQWDATQLYNSVRALYTDNCDNSLTVSLTNTLAGSNNTDCNWIFTYTYKIEDNCNNSVTCTVTRSGGDTEVPHLVNSQVDCSSLDITAQNECLSAASQWDATQLYNSVRALYTDNCDNSLTVTLTNTAGGTNNDCSWSFTYTYKIEDDCNNSVTCTVTRSGGDTEVPHLVNSQVDCSSLDITAQNECLSVASQWDATQLYNSVRALYTDNCDNTLTVTLINTAGGTNSDCSWSFTYTYKIEDDCNNSVTCTVTRSGGDTEVPHLVNSQVDCSSLDITAQNECLSAASQWDATQLYNSVRALYTDNCDNSLTVLLTNTLAGSNNTDCNWIFTYTYKIEDDCNNSVTCTVTRSGGDTEVPHLVNSQVDCSSLDITAQNECLSAASQWDATQLYNSVRALYTDNCDNSLTVTLINTAGGTNSDCSWSFTYTYKRALTRGRLQQFGDLHGDPQRRRYGSSSSGEQPGRLQQSGYNSPE
jgi:hypothetical protein